VDQPETAEERTSAGVSYVVGVDNADRIRDVTERYASQWLTATAKIRVDDGWWQQTLQLYRGPPQCCAKTIADTDADTDADEKAELAALHMNRGIPTSFGPFKAHKLYAIERHLRQNQVIYPKDPVLGLVKAEPVYPRCNVRTIRSRNGWRKEGRTVRLDLEPIKTIVGNGGRTRGGGGRGGGGGGTVADIDELGGGAAVELYGQWQTTLYVPPPCIAGRVPRNEFGTIDLFKSEMVPVGGVHLPYLGMDGTAKRLGIDAAKAVTGFEFRVGATHPVFDGVVVAKEFEELLLDAWASEQHEAHKEKVSGVVCSAQCTSKGEGADERGSRVGVGSCERARLGLDG
jgi:xeroderma pigmentosum group C-complementing protein